MHTLLVVVVCLVVGVGLGYAFRGKEHAALAKAGSDAKSVAQDVEKKL